MHFIPFVVVCLALFGSCTLASPASSHQSKKNECKHKLHSFPNPDQICYTFLGADRPATKTIIVVQGTPTHTVTNTVNVLVTQTPQGSGTDPSQRRRRDSHIVPRSTSYRSAADSLAYEFGREILDEVCFELVYGGKVPTTTTYVSPPDATINKTYTYNQFYSGPCDLQAAPGNMGTNLLSSAQDCASDCTSGGDVIAGGVPGCNHIAFRPGNQMEPPYCDESPGPVYCSNESPLLYDTYQLYELQGVTTS